MNYQLMQWRDPAIFVRHTMDFLDNKPNAGKKFQLEINNLGYDYNQKTGKYKILTSEDNKRLDQVYLARKKDPQLDQNAKTAIMILSLMHLTIQTVGSVIEYCD